MREMMGVMVVALLTVGAVSGLDDKASAKTGTKPEEVVKPMTGQCHCGNITYEARGPIVRCSYCDCRGCQRATGTLKAPFVTVQSAAFKITAGEPTRFRAQSGVKCDGHGVWHFCPQCGTPLFWKGDKGDELDIFAGTLDDTAAFQVKE